MALVHRAAPDGAADRRRRQDPLHRPGSPWENGCRESFNGKLRDELRNSAATRATPYLPEQSFDPTSPMSALRQKRTFAFAVGDWRTGSMLHPGHVLHLVMLLGSIGSRAPTILIIEGREAANGDDAFFVHW